MSELLSVGFDSGEGGSSAVFLGASGASKSLLGIYRGFGSLTSIRKRYFLLAEARKLYHVKGLLCCRRWLTPGKHSVLVLQSKEHHKCFYANLIRCGLLWQCPICGVVISERRRLELTAALEAAPYHQLLVTFTLRHRLSDSLQAVLGALLDAYRDFVRGAGWVGLQARYGFVGSVRGLEVTYGAAAGWHPHSHVLMLFEKPFSAKVFKQLQKEFKARWRMVINRYGFDASWKHGLDISSHQQRLAEYVEKFGRDPIIFDDGKGWTVEHELTKSAVKMGRFKGRTPTQLLLESAFGNSEAGALWTEYAKVFRGKHQLQYSRGLRDLLGMAAEKSDEQLATEEDDHASKLYELSAEQWLCVLEHELCAQLLEVGDFGGAGAIEAILCVLESSPDSLPAVLSGLYRIHGREYIYMGDTSNANAEVS